MITVKQLQDFDHVFAAIEFAQSQYPVHPIKPAKPVLKNQYDMVELSYHIEAVKSYEISKNFYDKELAAYKNTVADIEEIIEEYIKEESGLNSIPEQYRNNVYNKAYQDGHSNGFYSVYQELESLVEIFN